MLTKTIQTDELIVAGVRSPYIQAGPPDADEAVVFVHGNPGSSQDWAALVDKVGAFGRAVAPTMPGYGRADKPENFDYTVGGYARHLERIIQALGIRRVHLVLHDFGGQWGLAWAAAHPDKFASVTLVNIGVLKNYSWHYLARIWRAPVLGELFMAISTRPAFHLLFKHGNPRGLPKDFVNRMYDDFDSGTKRAVLKLYRSTDANGNAQKLATALRPLDRPALVIWGARDPYLPVRYAERQREVFPQAEVAILEHSGHWPIADDPDQVADLIIPFLRRQLGVEA